MRFNLIGKLLPFTLIILLVIPLTANSATTTISSFPYVASQAGTNYSETLFVAGTNLSTSGSALRVTGHDIVINLGNDTITFGTDNGSGYYGLEMSYSSYNIKLIGGTINHGGVGNRNNCIILYGVNDFLIENTDMRIAGTNGHCISTPSIAAPGNYNMEISGGNYRSDVTGYDSRCNYDGAVLVLGTTHAGYGDYHYKVHDINIVTGPSQGMTVGGRTGGNNCLTEIYNNTLHSDARNLTYTSGDNTCRSAANPYQIAVSRLAAGSKIYNNVITSGTTYGGCRGILMETCYGTDENPIEVYNNHLDIHEGPNLESPYGNVQVLRIRFGNSHIHVHDNVFIGTGGVGVGSSYGAGVIGLRITATNEEGHTPDHGLIIENNLFRANGLTGNLDVMAVALESFSNLGNIIRNNRFESVGTIISFGEGNYGASGICLESDTLVRLSPTSNPHTVIVGWRNYFNAQNDTLRDLVYEGGALESQVEFGDDNSDFRLQRTLKLQVYGNNDLPVPGVNVNVLNGYNQNILSGVTNSHGIVEGIVSYRWEVNPGTDSLGYNDFAVTATKGADSDQATFTVYSGSLMPNLILASTAGTDPGDLDPTAPGKINDLVEN